MSNEPKKLTSLKEHDEQKRKKYSQPPDHCNGIACPNCENQLRDVVYGEGHDLRNVLTSNPPKTPVFCDKCNYRGTRII